MNSSTADKLISALSYLTFGLFGIIWIIFANIRNRHINQFLYFNIGQSIFISILLTLISIIYDIAINFLAELPIIGKFAKMFYICFNQKALILNCSPSTLIIFALLIYLCGFSILGLMPKLPFVSNIIAANFRR